MQSESEHRRFMESAASDIPTCPSFEGQQVYNQVLDAMFTDRRINYGRLSVVSYYLGQQMSTSNMIQYQKRTTSYWQTSKQRHHPINVDAILQAEDLQFDYY